MPAPVPIVAETIKSAKKSNPPIESKEDNNKDDNAQNKTKTIQELDRQKLDKMVKILPKTVKNSHN